MSRVPVVQWLRQQSPRRRNLAIASVFDLACGLVVLLIPFYFDTVEGASVRTVVTYLLGEHWSWAAAFIASSLISGVAAYTDIPFWERLGTSITVAVATARGITIGIVGAMLFPRFAVILIIGALVWFRVAFTLYATAAQVERPFCPPEALATLLEDRG